MSKKVTPYLEIRDQLTTFTLINCVHRKFPWNLIGHTAVLFRNNIGQIMVFESTTLNKFTGKSGVQLTPFGLWLNNYPGKVYVRIPDEIFMDEILPAKTFIRNNLGTSYPDLSTMSGKLKLALSALDFKLFGVDYLTYGGDDNGIFCTMLVVMFLQYCKLFDKDMPANEFEPDDTRGNQEKFERRLKGISYGSEIRIK